MFFGYTLESPWDMVFWGGIAFLAVSGLFLIVTSVSDRKRGKEEERRDRG